MIRAHPLAHLLDDIYTGDARELTRYQDGTFDAVLCLGALYHVQEEGARERIIDECLRVLKTGGIFAYSFMSLMAVTFRQYMTAVRCLDPDERIRVYRLIDFCRSSHCVDIFYGMTMEEIYDTAKRHHLETLSVANTYSTFYGMNNEVNDYAPEQYEKYIQCLYDCCEDTAVAENCMHGIYFGIKI